MLSIIVPIKNQEKYLKKCMDSILGQTYKELEVIAVEDSSTDRSPEICQSYARQDRRVKVIHVNCNDISGARNVGVANVSGEIIGFVDPDDWIEPATFRYMIDLKSKTGASIVCCGKQEVYGDEPLLQPTKENVITLSCDEAVCELAGENKIRSHLWNKIYDRELFDGIQFEEGRIYEDLMVMHRLFLKAELIAVSNRIFYHYRQHPLSAVTKTNLKKKLDACYAVNCRIQDLLPIYPQLHAVLMKQYKFQILALMQEMNSSSKQELKIRWQDIQTEHKRCKALKIPMNGMAEKLFGWSPTAYLLFAKLKRSLRWKN